MRPTKHTPITLELAKRIDQLQGEINQLKRAVSQETLEYSVTHDGEKIKWV